MNLISPSLKLKVSWQIFSTVIRQNPIFKNRRYDNPFTTAMLKQTTQHSDPVPGSKDEVSSGTGADMVSMVVRKLEIQLN